MELNREQIIKALECCVTDSCVSCPYDDVGVYSQCVPTLLKNALALINSQEQRIEAYRQAFGEVRVSLAEANKERQELTVELEAMRGAANSYKINNEKLSEENERLHASCTELTQNLHECKADTVRKMQERLNEVVENSGNRVYTGSHVHLFFNQIAKEMLEGEK